MIRSNKWWRPIFAAFAMLGFLNPLSVRAGTITVTSNSDSGPGSLRDAIAAAASGDTINFSLAVYPASITLTSGTLTINTSLTISGPGASNLAISGNNSVQVFSVPSGVTVTISGVTIESGTSSAGGGIGNSGTVTLTNSTVTGNFATDYGGGIFNYGGTLNITNSTLSGNIVSPNSGGDGGGIWNWGTLNITNSTFSRNIAYLGGGMENYFGPAVITNSTFSGNSAVTGGGIFSYVFGTLAVKNTIVANSSSGGNCIDDGTSTSYGQNLSDDSSCSSFFNQTSDLNSTPAGLDPGGLQNNGGPTKTIALISGSPAIDAIPVSPTNNCTDFTGNVLGTDQRGVTRPQGAACDIGAFEFAEPYTAQIQQPVNGDGSSIFSAKRGVVPVKFTVALDNIATCDLPPATIALTRTAGGNLGTIDESVYEMSADSGSNFRIDSCQYMYNLYSKSLGVGVYRVDILINGSVVGSAVFALK